MVYPYIHNIGSPRFQRTVLNFLPWKRLHELRDVVDVMHRTSTDIFESAKKAVKEGKDIPDRPGGGKDIMSILSTFHPLIAVSSTLNAHSAVTVKANLNASEEDRLPDEELIAQISCVTS